MLQLFKIQICLFFLILFSGTAFSNEPFTCSKSTPAYDLKNPVKQIGAFLEGTKLELLGPPDSRNLVHVIFRSPDGKEVHALCRAEDVTKPVQTKPEEPKAASPTIVEPPKPKPEAPKISTENLKKPTSGSGKVFEGSHTIPGKLYANPEVKVDFRIPLGPDGKAGPNAHNIVFYAPWLPQKKIMKQEYIKHFSDKLGYTIFSFAINTDEKDIDDRKKCYYYPESGWFDKVFAAQEYLTKEYKLQPRKLLIMGISAGSTMAANIAVHRPTQVEAIAITGGSKYDLPKEKIQIPWCVLVTRGDMRIPANNDFVQKGRALGMNMLHAHTSPDWAKLMDKNFLHIPNQLALSLLENYLEGVVRMRDANNGLLAPEKWPLIASSKTPDNIVANTEEELQKIPAEERLFFPSSEFAELWKKNPADAEPFLDASSDNPSKFISRPLGKPKGVIVYGHSWIKGDRDGAVQNFQYLAEKGYIVLGRNITEKDAEGIAEFRETTQEALAQFPDLPIYLMGFARAGRLAILTACTDTDPRIKALAAISAEPDRPTPDVSPKHQISKLKIPLFLSYGDKDQGTPKKVDRARQLADTLKRDKKPVEMSVIPKVDFDLGDKWFEEFDKIIAFFERSATQ
jgi:dienelactone hydrolase